MVALPKTEMTSSQMMRMYVTSHSPVTQNTIDVGLWHYQESHFFAHSLAVKICHGYSDSE